MLESLRCLDAGLEPEAMAALAWFILRLRTSDEPGVESDIAFAGVGLLSLAVKSRETVSDAAIVELSEWLLAEEKREVDAWGESNRDFPNHWLFRTTHFMRHEKWLALGAELAAFEATGPCGDAVRAIGQRLSGERLEP